MDQPMIIKRGVLVWLLAMSLISPMIVALGGVWYTGHVERQSDHQWCELLGAIDRPPAPGITDPAVLKRNADFIVKIHRLRVNKGCVIR